MEKGKLERYTEPTFFFWLIGGKRDGTIARVLSVHRQTVWRVRRRYLEGGLESALRDPEYRERMYDILDIYEEPYHPQKPVLGVDEKNKQLIEDSRQRIQIKPGSLEKYDYQYKRKLCLINCLLSCCLLVGTKHREAYSPVTAEAESWRPPYQSSP